MNSLENTLFHSLAALHWKRVGVGPHHGISFPLSSLLTEQSCGIGEFLDLLPMIHWCKSIGMNVIQLLPVNDTGLEISPYNALSATALNPIYISLSTLPNLECVPEYKEKIAKIKYWNQTARVKYYLVRELKEAFFSQYLAAMQHEFTSLDSFRIFFETHKEWLEPYSLFKTLKEQQHWREWQEWPPDLKYLSETRFSELLKEHRERSLYHTLLQFIAFQQLERVKKEASEANIMLKGDIPILVSKESADTWRRPQDFLLHLTAGAPPDAYNKEGQLWGFPLYNWEEMEKNGYYFWKQRLRVASQFYHLYRVDHIVGFFRIWTIPKDKKPIEGSFFPYHESEWIAHGDKIIRMMLEATPILPIGEDLGLVPPYIRQHLNNMGVCGTKVMRWERRWNQDGSFIPIHEYSPISLTTVSTHDSETLELWWRHSPREAKLYCDSKGWDFRPFLNKERRIEILKDAHHTSSLFHINLLQEYLAIFPEFIAINPNDERINVPGKVLDINWTYRFCPSVETITQHIPLRHTLMDIIK